MRRTLLAFVVLVGLLVTLALSLEVRTDAAAVLGPDTTGAPPLGSVQGRAFTIAIIGTDPAKRSATARQVVEALRADPIIGRAEGAPRPPDPALLDWLWQHRLHLAPPVGISAEAMASNLEVAIASLTRAEGMVLGDYLLRDPTGSFARLSGQIQSMQPRLGVEHGIWQARDGQAALIFGQLADLPFDPDRTRALGEAVDAIARDAGQRAITIGARFVTARINAEIAQAAAIAALAATVLALGWLICRLGLRSLVLGALLPVAIGVALAGMVTQMAFGAVHVIALGFGGCLVGLALDYPLHLLAHPDHARARRLVLIGAATTAVAFLALLGTGLEVLQQTGLFVATGLVGAALASLWLVRDARPNGPSPGRIGIAVKLPAIVPSAVLAIAGGVLLLRPEEPPAPVFDPPNWLEDDLSRLREVTDLPSGRFQLVVSAPDEAQLHLRARALQAELRDAGVASPAIVMPGVAAQRDAANALPNIETYRALAAEAASRSGLRPDFVAAIVAAYAAARQAPPVTPDRMPAMLRALSPLVEKMPDGVRMIVPTGRIADTDALSGRIAAADLPGVTLIDLRQVLAERVAGLERAALRALTIGVALAFVVLAAGLRMPGRVLYLGLVTGAAALGTAALLSLAGPLGVFQIVALSLVAGIGIDYGLFLILSPASAGARSVWLCAVTTLIAFGALALAPVKILSDIGLTVTLGVFLVLGLCLIGPKEDTARDAEDR